MRPCLVLLAALLLVAPARAAFEFDENVSEALQAGTKAFKAGRDQEAVVEFENLLLLAPGHPGGHELLFQVYLRLGRVGLARRLLGRIRDGRLLAGAKLRELEGMLPAGGATGVAPRGSFFDGGAPALPPPGAAGPSGEQRLARVEELEALPLDAGLDDLLEDLETPAPPSATGGGATAGGSPGPAGAAPDASLPSDPRALHAHAVGLFRRTGSALQAGALLVKALESLPELLAEPDGGLFDATYGAYTDKLRQDPANLDARFVLAFLEEKRGEEDQAVLDYERIAKGAPPGSRLAIVSAARAQALQAEKKRQEDEKRAQAAVRARENLERSLDAIAQGQHEEVKEAGGFRDRGREIHKKWQDSRDPFELKAASKWFQGAIAKEPSNGENHYLYALVKIDLATEGEPGARDEAKAALEKALALKPPDSVRVDAENLLKALSK